MESRIATSFDTIRIDEAGKQRLNKLRRQLGVENWNVICRLAYTSAVASGSLRDAQVGTNSNIEISWKTFVGAYDLEFRALSTCHEGRSVQEMIHIGLSLLERKFSKMSRSEALQALINEFQISKN